MGEARSILIGTRSTKPVQASRRRQGRDRIKPAGKEQTTALLGEGSFREVRFACPSGVKVIDLSIDCGLGHSNRHSARNVSTEI